jgi:hypothetical protein
MYYPADVPLPPSMAETFKSNDALAGIFHGSLVAPEDITTRYRLVSGPWPAWRQRTIRNEPIMEAMESVSTADLARDPVRVIEGVLRGLIGRTLRLRCADGFSHWKQVTNSFSR